MFEGVPVFALVKVNERVPHFDCRIQLRDRPWTQFKRWMGVESIYLGNPRDSIDRTESI